jgi:two-component system chemotaxis response regulator CheB
MQAKSPYEVLIIGGSAGSLSMVLKIIPQLKKEMNLSVILVFHRKQSEDTTLIDLLSLRTEYTVKDADDKDDVLPGVIYVAPADYHVLIERNHTITLDDSEKINFSRPSIDVTFETAAEVYGKSLACILLSGANADGVQGLVRAKSLGSLIIVQDPASAEVSFMPQRALENVDVDLLINYQNLGVLFDFLSGKKRK